MIRNICSKNLWIFMAGRTSGVRLMLLHICLNPRAVIVPKIPLFGKEGRGEIL
jgi:hypothetical protein